MAKVVVQKLKIGHAKHMADMLRKFKEEATTWADAKLSLTMAEDFFKQAANRKDLVCYAAINAGTRKVVGFSKAHIDQTYFGPDLVCFEYTLYVMPEFRNRGYGIRMAKLTKQSLDEGGVRHMVVSNTTGIEPEVYAKVAQRIFGLTQVGSVFK